MHHAKSDTVDDPHSPVYVGIWRVIISRWHVEYIPKKYIVDLLKNPRVVFFHRYRKHIHFAYAAAMLIAGINYFIIFVAMPFILAWAGFGLLNWMAHKEGKPADVPIMNIIAPGEGWHKYHHDHPMAYKLNRFDIAGWIIERVFIKSKL
jgi:fatty-acid desaturase